VLHVFDTEVEFFGKDGRHMPRGAPKGNTNALKHGFYARKFRSQEVQDLDALQEGGLKDLISEIGILRIAIARTFAQANELEAAGETIDWIAYLSGIGKAATRVATMLKTQKILEGDQGDLVNAALIQAITEYAKEENLSV
jgi:hypothetical protein